MLYEGNWVTFMTTRLTRQSEVKSDERKGVKQQE